MLNYMPSISIYLSDKEHREAVLIADREELELNKWVRKLIREEIKSKGR